MYYSSGNYEAFAHPKKPEGVDHKSAYIIGSGLAALTAACYLVRDGQMKGEHVHVFEKNALAGGACDGYMPFGCKITAKNAPLEQMHPRQPLQLSATCCHRI